MTDIEGPSGPPGVRIDGSIVAFPPSVVVLAVLASRKIIFVEQYRPSAGRTTLELPGGRKQPNESLEEAARREFGEETGYECGQLEHITCLDLDFSASRHQTSVFLTEEIRPQQWVDMVHQYTVTEALRMVKDGQITHAPSAFAVLWISLWEG